MTSVEFVQTRTPISSLRASMDPIFGLHTTNDLYAFVFRLHLYYSDYPINQE